MLFHIWDYFISTIISLKTVFLFLSVFFLWESCLSDIEHSQLFLYVSYISLLFYIFGFSSPSLFKVSPSLYFEYFYFFP